MFLKNCIIADQSISSFQNNMSVIIRKVDSIYKEICEKNQRYSYLFTMVLKAKELIGDFGLKYNENSLK